MTLRSLRVGRSRARVRPGARPGVAGIGVVATLAVAALASCGSSSVASAVRANAVTVDGTSISRRDFQHDISALAANKKFVALDKQVAAQGSASQRLFDSSGKATRVLTTSWMNRLVNQIIVDREVKRLHLQISADDRTQGESQFAALFSTQSVQGTDIVVQFPKWFRDQEKEREARLIALTHSLDARHPIAESAMLAFYTKNVGSLCPSGFEVAHILVKTLAQAQALETQLGAGGDFATLAKTASIDTGSAAKGGSLGCFATGQYVAAFEAGVAKAKVGVPTAPVKSEFGYHIILKTKYVPPTFEAVKAEIRQELLKEANNLGAFVKAGLKKAKVHVDPLYGTWSTKDNKVNAPKVPEVRNSRNAPTTPTS
jgi:foldase protein PrsA